MKVLNIGLIFGFFVAATAEAEPIRVFAWADDISLRACLVSELSQLDGVEIVKERPDFSLAVVTKQSPGVVVASVTVQRMMSRGANLVRSFAPEATPAATDNLQKLFAMLGTEEIHAIFLDDSTSVACPKIVQLANRSVFEPERKPCEVLDSTACILLRFGARPVISAKPSVRDPPRVGPSPTTLPADFAAWDKPAPKP